MGRNNYPDRAFKVMSLARDPGTGRAILLKSPNRPEQPTRRLMIEATYQI